VFAGALLLFSLRLTVFEARQTDISALRIMAGDVPYRDFWTMYAPGSFLVLGTLYRLLGAQLVVSNALGILTSAAGVATLFTVARRVAPPAVAASVAAIVAAVFFSTGYADGFTSFPPAFLLVTLAAHLAAGAADRDTASWAVRPGLLLGAAALFKHDIAAYATLSLAVSLMLVRRRQGVRAALAPAFVLAASAAALPLLAMAVLVRAGAGPDAWSDLVRFPLGDYRFVRREYFPLLPHLRDTLVNDVRDLRGWAVCNLPTLAALAGLLALRSRRDHMARGSALIVTFATLLFACHWWAAHIQINTNGISLAAWGGVVGAAGLGGLPSSTSRRAFATLVVTGWAVLMLAEPLYREASGLAAGRTWVGLPHLRGIRASAADARALRDLASAMEDAGPRSARLLFASERNDLVIYAQSVPFWLTDRRPATRHSELHPGVTDIEVTQRQMLDGLSTRPLPVVVREHRFDDHTLDQMKVEIQPHVPVGSRLLDAWINEHFVAGELYGAYEVMAPRASVVLRGLP